MRKFTTAALFAILLSACVKQDYDTSDCDSNLRIEFDWLGGAAPLDQDEMITVRIYPESGDPITITSPLAGTDILLPVGNYEFVATEPMQNVTLSGTVVSVDPTIYGNGSDPSHFSAGRIEDRIRSEIFDQTVTIPMRRQTRDLILRVDFTNDNYALVNSASALIGQVATSRSIESGFPPVNGFDAQPALSSAVIPFDLQAENFPNPDDEWFEARHVIIGMDGEVQKTLSMTIDLAGQIFDNVEFDITGMFVGFNTVDLPEPWIIEITFDVDVDLELIIIDWSAGTESDLIAE